MTMASPSPTHLPLLEAFGGINRILHPVSDARGEFAFKLQTCVRVLGTAKAHTTK